jgi:demethoxyubiquinone hydroxylase (CLK1/Coq7/Cat5 family)
MDREGGIIGLRSKGKVRLDGEINVVAHLNDRIRNLRTGDNRVRAHHPIGVLLTNFRDEEGTHTGTSATT